MCFIKSPKAIETVAVEQEPIAELKEANASITKNSSNQENQTKNQNIKTTPLGLIDEAPVQKKTLLGE